MARESIVYTSPESRVCPFATCPSKVGKGNYLWHRDASVAFASKSLLVTHLKEFHPTAIVVDGQGNSALFITCISFTLFLVVDADTFNAVLADEEVDGWSEFIRAAPSEFLLDREAELRGRFSAFIQAAMENCNLTEIQTRSIFAILEAPRIPNVLTQSNLQRRVFYHLFLADEVDPSLIDYIIMASVKRDPAGSHRRRKQRQRSGTAQELPPDRDDGLQHDQHEDLDPRVDQSRDEGLVDQPNKDFWDDYDDPRPEMDDHRQLNNQEDRYEHGEDENTDPRRRKRFRRS